MRNPVPLWSKLATQSCDGALIFLEKLGKQLSSISGDPARTATLFEGALRAFKSYSRTVTGKPPGPRTAFPWDAKVSSS